MTRLFKTLLTAALLTIMPTMLCAQACDTVAAGTSSAQQLPFYLFNAPYAQWTQSIYTADRLTALQGKTLTAFTYHTAISTFTPAPGTWTVSLAITTKSDLEQGKDNTPCTQVFSGTPTFADGNLTFTFDTPFVYNGGNLLVYFDHQAGTTTEQQSTTFWSTVMYENRASRYACNNSHNTSAYNGEGAISAYLPTIYVSSSDGGETTDTCTVAVSPSEPFFETFADTWTDGKPDACWSNSHISGAGVSKWSKSYQGHDDMYGAQMAYDFYASENTAKANLVSPRLSIPQGGAYNVGLWLKRISYSSVRSEAGVRVFVNTTPDTVGATLLFFAPQHIGVAPTVSAEGWYHYEGTIPEAGEQYVIVQGVDQGMHNIWIDELQVTLGTTSCDNPSELQWDGSAVTWQAGNATEWQVRDGDSLAIVATPSYSDPTWAPASMHDVYVRSICGEGDTLEWRGPVSFSLPCETIYLDGTNSYSENFDALTTSGTLPACWQTAHVSGPGSSLWGSYSAVSAHSGNRLMNLPDMHATTLTDLVMPTVNIADSGSYELSLWIYRSNGTKPNEGVRAWASTTTDTTGGIPLFHARRCAGQEPAVDTFGWYEYTGVIPMAGEVHIVLQGISEYGQQTWIDDVSIRPVGSSPTPTPVDTATTDTTVAVVDAGIAASDIIYWVGEGGNEVVFAVNWADSALAWGYRFATDSVVVGTIISDIVEADPRLSIEGDPTFVSNFIFTDSANNVTLSITPHDPDDYSVYFNMQVNHVSSMLGAGSHMVGNGDFVKFADTYVAVKADSTWIEDWGGYWDYTYVWPYAITPVGEPATTDTTTTDTTTTTLLDATIGASDIRYWVGTGSNEVILAINWVDTALAWGYRFQAASTTVQEVMDSLTAADPRLSYSGTGFLDDIIFTENGTSHQAQQAGWWMSTLNGNSNASMGLATELHDGDFFKWGDYAVGTTVDPETWAMVFTDSIYAVSEPGTPTDPTAIGATEGVQLNLWPNPTSGEVCVTAGSDADAVLFDMAGRRMMTVSLRQGRNTIDLGSLENGIYMLRIEGNTVKIVKK